MGEIPRGLTRELLVFCDDAGPIGPLAFRAGRFHLVASSGPTRGGQRSWTLLHPWRLVDESVRVEAPAWNVPR